MRIEGMTIDDVRLRPCGCNWPALLAVIPPPGTTPTPAQGARDAGKGWPASMRAWGSENAEMHGPQWTHRKALSGSSTMRFNLEDGKVGEFAMEGFNARTPERAHHGSGALRLKSLDNRQPLANIGACTQIRHKSLPPDQALRLFLLLEGAEMKGLVVPL